MKRICLFLWLLVPVPLIVGSGATPVSDAVKVVDVAREKDVVWLSLATAIAAIGAGAWHQYRHDKQSDAATQALVAAAKAITSFDNTVKELRQDMHDRGWNASDSKRPKE